jgi:hypothetical protein
VNGQLVGACGVSTATKLDARVHEGRHEGEVTREPIKLGDYRPGLVLAAGVNRSCQLGGGQTSCRS